MAYTLTNIVENVTFSSLKYESTYFNYECSDGTKVANSL
ncbi:Uncharacterised protein [Staphylococcus aureus]|uniref:Uncharacterized protein n=1 Tax=Staphylococcus aureus TaxID=1280 RepID=A0A8G2MAA9_STAAU|nr:hypothetical protein SA21342_0114 [Staphylococcus aureus subsp. aureus 21342]EZH95841.1 hypothetical protein SA21275_1160 [Staphylococcus aureus subsp. aureus 21275]KAG35033.1 hypothetical protein W764_02101 [Staphylococcus aureus VET0889S]TID11215.1 hypothetical protein SA21204_1786 [Staphylococcus aureus subsp. aureus 21204]CAC6076223.1 Uncharacterised protein [Staphylococcus aureus]